MCRRTIILCAIVALTDTTLYLARNVIVQSFVDFVGPHDVRAPKAVIEDKLAGRLNDASSPQTPEALIAFALNVTAEQLHFGLGHRTHGW